MSEMPTPIDPAAEILDKAKAIVTGARRQTYGLPEDNFQTIARLWNAYLIKRGLVAESNPIKVIDVPILMGLVKIARLAENPTHEDSGVDLIGYTACWNRCRTIPDPIKTEIPPTPTHCYQWDRETGKPKKVPVDINSLDMGGES